MTINLHQAWYFARHFFSAKRNGHGIHSPFAYRLCEDVFYNTDSFYDFEELWLLRQSLLGNETVVTIEDFGAGSKAFKSNTRQIKDIAAKGISTVQQSELLYKLINFLGCKNGIELGTSLGLNTLYLAKACRGQITTIEGSKALADFAQNLAKKNKISGIRFVHGRFDEVLPALLEQTSPLDLLYVDGNHTYEATLHYFNLALEKKHSHSLFVFDDIYWSPGMTAAWKAIKRHPQVTLSLDLFHFGIVFFREEVREKVDLKLFI